MTTTRTAAQTISTRKATWEMDKVELAKVFAEHFGYSHRGNWITRPLDGKGIACGWEHFADRIAQKGWIVVGTGINWRKAGERPNLSKASKNEHGYWA